MLSRSYYEYLIMTVTTSLLYCQGHLDNGCVTAMYGHGRKREVTEVQANDGAM